MKKLCKRCGKLWKRVPKNATLKIIGDKFDGYYWHCECGTTLFKALKKDILELTIAIGALVFFLWLVYTIKDWPI